MRHGILSSIALFGVVLVSASEAVAEDESPASDPIAPLVPEFKDLTLVGQFTIDRGATTQPGKPERYEIKGVQPAAKGMHLVQARIRYGKNDVTVPVPVKLHEAGPKSVVMSLDDLTIPLLGDKFDARVVFDFASGRYAGTWMHGDVGGHMWGRLEHSVPKDKILVVPDSEVQTPIE